MKKRAGYISLLSAVAGLALLAAPALSADFVIGDFSSGSLDGWQTTTDCPVPADYSVAVADWAGYGNMLNMRWQKDPDVLLGTYFGVSKSWDASLQGTTADSFSIDFRAPDGGHVWNSFFTAEFASEGSGIQHTNNVYWPAQQSTLTLYAGFFGVSQSTFATMDKLTFFLTPISLDNTGGTQANLYLGNIRLNNATPTAAVPEASSLALAIPTLGAGLGLMWRKKK